MHRVEKTLKRLQAETNSFWKRFGNDCKRLHYLQDFGTFAGEICSFYREMAKGTDLGSVPFVDSLPGSAFGQSSLT
jgi:hypothetical protein